MQDFALILVGSVVFFSGVTLALVGLGMIMKWACGGD